MGESMNRNRTEKGRNAEESDARVLLILWGKSGEVIAGEKTQVPISLFPSFCLSSLDERQKPEVKGVGGLGAKGAAAGGGRGGQGRV